MFLKKGGDEKRKGGPDTRFHTMQILNTRVGSDVRCIFYVL